MPKYSLFGLARPSFWLLLAGGLTACGSDTPTSSVPQRDSQPSSSDGEDVEEDDVSDDDADPRSDDADEQSSSLDAGLTTPRQSDAGRASAARPDAGDAGSVSKPPDAATPSGAGDAATTSSAVDAGSADAALDGGTPASSRDAESPVADAQTPSTSPARTFKVDSKDEWTASGFQVEAGRCYDITAKIDDRWLDLDVPADLSGWVDKDDVRLILFEPLRRVTQDDIRFYQFATCVDKKLNQCFPVNASSSVCPKTAGELFFFVNDVSGFESNNVGTATVTIQAK